MSDNKDINNQQAIIVSPCISNCCLDDEDICLGCFRHIEEITGWHSADRQGRLMILQKAKDRKAQCVFRRLD